MNQEELEQYLQETYDQYLYEIEKLKEQQRLVNNLKKEVEDLNTALRVVKSLRTTAPGPHHKD